MKTRQSKWKGYLKKYLISLAVIVVALVVIVAIFMTAEIWKQGIVQFPHLCEEHSISHPGARIDYVCAPGMNCSGLPQYTEGPAEKYHTCIWNWRKLYEKWGIVAM